MDKTGWNKERRNRQSGINAGKIHKNLPVEFDAICTGNRGNSSLWHAAPEIPDVHAWESACHRLESGQVPASYAQNPWHGFGSCPFLSPECTACPSLSDGNGCGNWNGPAVGTNRKSGLAAGISHIRKEALLFLGSGLCCWNRDGSYLQKQKLSSLFDRTFPAWQV